MTEFLALRDMIFSFLSLTRSKTHYNEAFRILLLSLSIVTDLLHRINALAQHENDWIVRLRGTEQILNWADRADGVLLSQVHL